MFLLVVRHAYPLCHFYGAGAFLVFHNFIKLNSVKIFDLHSSLINCLNRTWDLFIERGSEKDLPFSPGCCTSEWVGERVADLTARISSEEIFACFSNRSTMVGM